MDAAKLGNCALLRAIKLLYILPAPLHLLDGQVKLRERFEPVERGGITLLLVWLVEESRGRGSTWLKDPAHEATDATKLENYSVLRAIKLCYVHPPIPSEAVRLVRVRRMN